jgi:hypothetical protein
MLNGLTDHLYSRETDRHIPEYASVYQAEVTGRKADLSVDVVDTDVVVSVTGEQGLAIGRPGKGSAVRDSRVLASGGKVTLDLVNHNLELKIPDLNAGLGGSN